MTSIREQNLADLLVKVVCACGPSRHGRGYPECATAREAARIAYAFAQPEAFAVKQGSILVVRGEPLEPEVMDCFVSEIARVAQHREFVVVHLSDGTEFDALYDPEQMKVLMGISQDAEDEWEGGT